MGNGQAPGTATGLGMAGAGVAVTGFGASRRWTAGLAVFFFAAFLTAGFLAGFFLPPPLRLAADFRAEPGAARLIDDHHVGLFSRDGRRAFLSRL